MVLTMKFYDYLHELEENGSVARFDMNAPELRKLHELASGTFEDRRRNCISLLERGFDKWEISAETEFAASVIDNFRREAKIPLGTNPIGFTFSRRSWNGTCKNFS